MIMIAKHLRSIGVLAMYQALLKAFYIPNYYYHRHFTNEEPRHREVNSSVHTTRKQRNQDF